MNWKQALENWTRVCDSCTAFAVTFNLIWTKPKLDTGNSTQTWKYKTVMCNPSSLIAKDKHVGRHVKFNLTESDTAFLEPPLPRCFPQHRSRFSHTARVHKSALFLLLMMCWEKTGLFNYSFESCYFMLIRCKFRRVLCRRVRYFSRIHRGFVWPAKRSLLTQEIHMPRISLNDFCECAAPSGDSCCTCVDRRLWFSIYLWSSATASALL